ncbi:DUF4145 domain-containing protein [Nonomuraea sp. 3N208]|uniref:DUF4145 domain-containing protein n=1 Tax=Nonomuraea sp. 3N208 TaxID=3457421 RepID=UPI003FCEC01E
MERLDDNTIRQIGRLICGDDTAYRRQGYELAKFLRDAGWMDVPEYGGEPRREWIIERLRERRDQPEAMERAILRLSDPREYLGEPPSTVAEITMAVNALLVHEGYKVERPGGRPRIIECDPASASPGSLAPVTLKVTMAQVVVDPQYAKILQARLDEARTCTENGCHIAAIIMLGSLLEGVLLDVMSARLGQPPQRKSLHDLIDQARQHGFIGVDVQKFSHALRDYRNLVHPHAQVRMSDPPNRDTVEICWPVVNATLNDLAASAVA